MLFADVLEACDGSPETFTAIIAAYERTGQTVDAFARGERLARLEMHGVLNRARLRTTEFPLRGNLSELVARLSDELVP